MLSHSILSLHFPAPLSLCFLLFRSIFFQLSLYNFSLHFLLYFLSLLSTFSLYFLFSFLSQLSLCTLSILLSPFFALLSLYILSLNLFSTFSLGSSLYFLFIAQYFIAQSFSLYFLLIFSLNFFSQLSPSTFSLHFLTPIFLSPLSLFLFHFLSPPLSTLLILSHFSSLFITPFFCLLFLFYSILSKPKHRITIHFHGSRCQTIGWNRDSLLFLLPYHSPATPLQCHSVLTY